MFSKIDVWGVFLIQFSIETRQYKYCKIVARIEQYIPFSTYVYNVRLQDSWCDVLKKNLYQVSIR